MKNYGGVRLLWLILSICSLLLADAGFAEVSAVRFISLAPNITETVAWLGGAGRLIGITNDCNYPPEVSGKTKLGKYTQPDMEKIIALQPAIVLLESTADPRFKVKLRDLNVVYYEYDFVAFKNYFEELRKLNTALALQSEVKIQELEKLWQKKLPPLNKKVVIVVGQRPPIAAGRGTFLSDFFTGLGCQNIVSGVARYPEVDPALFFKADLILDVSGQDWSLGRGLWPVVQLEQDIYARLSPRLLLAREEAHRQLSYYQWTSAHKARLIREYRLLRIVMALLAGAGLALSGLLYQSMLLNPLAEPYLLGVSSGAAVGALCGLLLNVLPFGMAIAGAVCALLLVYTLARKKNKIENNGLILSGVMINSFCGALIMLAVFWAGSKVNSLMFWLLGDLGLANWTQAGLLAAALLAVTGFAFWQSPRIEILSVGDEQAESLGVETGTLKTFLLFLISALTALIVASVGIIGFVGLIIPHIVKMLCGEKLAVNVFAVIFQSIVPVADSVLTHLP